MGSRGGCPERAHRWSQWEGLSGPGPLSWAGRGSSQGRGSRGRAQHVKGGSVARSGGGAHLWDGPPGRPNYCAPKRGRDPKTGQEYSWGGAGGLEKGPIPEQQADPQSARGPAPTSLNRPFPRSGQPPSLAGEHAGVVDMTLRGLRGWEPEEGEVAAPEISWGREPRWPLGPGCCRPQPADIQGSLSCGHAGK